MHIDLLSHDSSVLCSCSQDVKKFGTNLCVSYSIMVDTEQVMLEGVKAALTADIGFQDGWYKEIPSKGLRAAARVYAGWGFSQAFYWNEVSKAFEYS